LRITPAIPPLFFRTLFALSVLLFLQTASTGQSISAKSVSLEQAGDAAAKAGRVDQALANYQQALQLQPRSARLNQKTGDLLLASGRVPEAISSYQAALSYDPANEKSCLGLAAAYRQAFNYDQARKILHGCAAQHPNSGLAWVELGDLDTKQQRYDKAIAELKKGFERSPWLSMAHGKFCIAYFSKGET